jgi:hypothetical protein
MRKLRATMILLGCVALGLTAWAQTEPARQWWQKGQDAARDQQSEWTVGYFEESLRLDPILHQNHLRLAAASIEKGEETTACIHLAHYLDENPKHHSVRIHYAELLLRIGRIDLAKLEFNRFLLDTEREAIYASDWVHCHERLVEIAKVQSDHYQARLHRGIALYLMVQDFATVAPDDECNLEGMLCRAAADLTAAHMLEQGNARPCWYLHLVWAKLGQSQQSDRFLTEARRLALFNDLTPGEEQLLAASGSCPHPSRPLKW